VAFYSYDTCHNTPDCYTDIAWKTPEELTVKPPPAACPYDSTDNGWYTAGQCANGWGVCPCTYQGLELPGDSVYLNFPNKEPEDCVPAADGTVDPVTYKSGTCKKWPGMYQTAAVVKHYGTSCAPWDQMPGTPWHSYCPDASDWSHQDYNWCQQPWCYVSANCADRVPSATFKGSPAAYYSYLSCGATADCYTAVAWQKKADGTTPVDFPTGCPYDPTVSLTYKVHKAGNCACMFQGSSLSEDIYAGNYPELKPAGCTCKQHDGCPAETKCDAWPGMYNDMVKYAAIKFYGTTCAAWDQMKGTPWFDYCPVGSKWCSYDFNWCQQPWCYVSASCPSAVPSSVFKGSTVAQYSYDTCLGTPDCYTKVAWKTGADLDPAGTVIHGADGTENKQTCPYDLFDNNWYTTGRCTSGWELTTTMAPVSSANIAGLAASVMTSVMVALAMQA